MPELSTSTPTAVGAPRVRLVVLVGAAVAVLLTVLAVPAVAASPIAQRYAQLGGSSGILGAPVNNEQCGLVRGGCFRHYQHGSIYWTADTGAKWTRGAIKNTWRSTGWELGVLGYPTTDENCGLTGGGCYQHFEGGSIHYAPGIGAHWSRGGIRSLWGSTGWERGLLGYPTTSERCGLVNSGCYQHFQKGSVYWSPGTGAHWIRGSIRNTWSSLGWERSYLRYPTSNEVCSGTECHQTFTGGRMDWTRSTGVTTVTTPSLGRSTPAHSTAWRSCTATVAGKRVDVSASQRTVMIVDQTSKTYATFSHLTRTNTNCGFLRVVYTTARLGYGGTVWWSDRRQNTGTTPRGSFLMTESFGNGSAPTTQMPYRVTTNDDYWVLDQKAALSIYNEPRKGSAGGFDKHEAERLRDFTTQYRLAVVFDFNRKSNPKVMGRGGGIFLHVHGSGATAGCVSVTLTEMQIVMRYLKAGDKVVITT
ncbi:L,D-transpeptidase family protein [Propionibacteriaceae bacterium Y2011]